ncbi:MAG: ABC transporter substrate-binding protein [bacterium]|nr:ABC transporter substrate-binding protein [bacterium]
MKKIFSILGWRFDLPSATEIKAIIRRFSKKERSFFFFFLILFITAGTALLLQTNNIFSKEVPAQSGVWREGVVGLPHLINPILAVSDTDRDLVSLIYAGLLRPDGKGRLIHDLAESYAVSEDGLSYTFTLKKDLVWHDNTPITTEDIAFTAMLAKNPALKSPIRASWEGVTPVITNEREIQFLLERQYAPFLENMTLGILPKHIWNNIPPEQISLSKFNIEPIGAGPYRLKSIERNSSGIVTKYILRSFKNFAHGEPLISHFEFVFYPSERALITGFESKEIDGIAGIPPKQIETIKRTGTMLYELTLPRVFAVFFNQNKLNIFSKTEIREALERAIDKESIVKEILNGFAEPLVGPIPPGTFSAIHSAVDESITSTSSAEHALLLFKQNGWTKDEESGLLTNKDGDVLRFTISTSNVSDLTATAELLKSMWGVIGIQVDIKLFELSDLNQNVIRPREYEALLFGEVVGRDPDPFAFWHSSQRNDPGLNIALYTNSVVDSLLEEARKISDEEKRKEKYIEFQKEVIADHAATFLYSPLYLYIVDKKLKGFSAENITIPAERYAQIYTWYLHTKKVFHSPF